MMNSERLAKSLAVINLVLLVVTNILTLWIWYSVFTSDGDTMFLGIFLIPLAIVTIYYLALLRWGIKLIKTNSEPRNRLVQSFVLFFMNVVPMTFIYYLTT